MNVKLGYEVGTGAEVTVPVAHMIVTGQSQLSGKTTTLEALVSRATGMRALAFRTKRGESAFGQRSQVVPPYFRQRTDWQFVASVLEAETREKMRFERAWIMKAVRGAGSLADVRRNLNKLQAKSKRSMDQDVYMVLGAYLDAVLPVLARVQFADRVHLRHSLSVVDLGELPVNVQGLVISSMLQWVHERERDVTVILPESWKYIPQGRNSPVKMAAVSLAREGAGIGNFLWLDSQDLAGAEKEIVRQASVYVMGVQREVNEVRRALAHIPAGIKKPRAEDLATLGRGQFFACWGTHAVKTYVQPAWMDEQTAYAIAVGACDASVGARPDPIAIVVMGAGLAAEAAAAPDRRLSYAEGQLAARERVARLVAERDGASVEHEKQQVPEEDEMNAQQEEKLNRLIAAVTMLVEKLDNPVTTSTLRSEDEESRERMEATRSVTRDGNPVGTFDIDKLYGQFRERALKDPVLLKILVAKPELQIVVERQVIEVDGKTVRGRIGRLIHTGYFDEPKTGYAVWQELARTGTDHGKPNTYSELGELMKMGFFEKIRIEASKGDGYKVIKDMKVNVVRK